MTEAMTEAEALDAVRRTISGTVIRSRNGSHGLLGYDNAETIIRALSAQGWFWVRRTDAEQWDRLRATAAQR